MRCERVLGDAGNKVAVLGGDFLLARASIQLARLPNTEVSGAAGLADSSPARFWWIQCDLLVVRPLLSHLGCCLQCVYVQTGIKLLLLLFLLPCSWSMVLE